MRFKISVDFPEPVVLLSKQQSSEYQLDVPRYPVTIVMGTGDMVLSRSTKQLVRLGALGTRKLPGAAPPKYLALGREIVPNNVVLLDCTSRFTLQRNHQKQESLGSTEPPYVIVVVR